MNYVTLHVSVWVEIVGDASTHPSCESRSTWACELKLIIKIPVRKISRHAPRERVSWNRLWLWQRDRYRVTLHVSVWVEMHSPKGQGYWKTSRSTWACELKLPYILIIQAMTCHAPRERVSWNFCLIFIHYTDKVTLHVSVWVEITCSSVREQALWSRSTWACELKLISCIIAEQFQSHAPRERVSWNLMLFCHCKILTQSRSTWACELKCMVCNANPRTTSHAPRERVSWNLLNLYRY